MLLHYFEKVFSCAMSKILNYKEDNVCVRLARRKLMDDRDAQMFSHHNGLWRGNSREVADTVSCLTEQLTTASSFSLGFLCG